jgi:hypothetical protein
VEGDDQLRDARDDGEDLEGQREERGGEKVARSAAVTVAWSIEAIPVDQRQLEFPPSDN